MKDLKTVLHTDNVAPHEPWHLCVSSLSTLLYQDRSKEPCGVHMLDCSGSKPKPVDGKNIVHIQQDSIFDMCVAWDENKEFLVVTGWLSYELSMYNTATNELEWSMWMKQGHLDKIMDPHIKHKQMPKKMDPCRIITDGCGHLCVIGTTSVSRCSVS